jgi:putative phosphoribosyl transferase
MSSATSSVEVSAPPATLPAIQQVVVPVDGVLLPAELVVPADAPGVVVFIRGCGCVHETARAASIARRIEVAGNATFSLSLLVEAEEEKDQQTGCWSFDLELLTHRLLAATRWVMQQPQTRQLGIGYTGTNTFAAAALVVAGQLGYAVQAVVARSGRPDFAGEWLPRVAASTLLIVGERDGPIVELNRSACARLRCPKRLSIVPGAGHLFDEPGTLAQVGKLAADWFQAHLKAIQHG